MVVMIDDCAACGHRVSEFGSVIICDYEGHATARHAFESAWGPAYVTDCPASGPAEISER